MSHKTIFYFLMILFINQQTLLTKQSKLTFKSTTELLAANQKTIYTIPLINPNAAKTIILGDLTIDTIAYNNHEKIIWATCRYNNSRELKNDLIAISEENPQNYFCWSSITNLLSTNQQTDIFLAPFGEPILTLSMKHLIYKTNAALFEPDRAPDNPPKDEDSTKFLIQYQPILMMFPSILDKKTHQIIGTPKNYLAEIFDYVGITCIKTIYNNIFLWNPISSVLTQLNSYLDNNIKFGALSSWGDLVFIATQKKGALLFFDMKTDEILTGKIIYFGQNSTNQLEGNIICGTFSKNSKYLLIIDEKPTTKDIATTYNMLIFDVLSQKIISYCSYDFKNQFYDDFLFESTALSNDGKTIAILSRNGILYILNTVMQTIFSKKI